MALVLNTNSYVEINSADEYFENRIDAAAWENASYTHKEQALVTATQLIDNNPWVGYAVSPSQALAWPRKEASYFDPRMGQVIYLTETDIPDAVLVAIYEQALHLLNNEDLIMGTTQTYESISVGPISVSDTNGDVTKTEITPAFVKGKIRPLIRRSGMSSGKAWWRAN